MMQAVFKCQVIRMYVLKVEKHFSKVIGDKRRGSLLAKLCLAEFPKDLPITNGFSLTHLLPSCSSYMGIITRTAKCVLIFSGVYLHDTSQI